MLLDYLATDRAAGRVWIPAGGTGSVDVLDATSNTVSRIEGFPTAEAELFGKKVTVGPSAVTIGPGVVFVGNRGDAKICAIDSQSLKLGACFAFAAPGSGLAGSPDGLAYVGTTHELWVTVGAPPIGVAPPEPAVVVLDASAPQALRPKTKVPIDGEAEGYAVDDRKGVFYTNLADKDRTLAIDVRTHRVIATWQPACGGEGPRGLAVDAVRGFLFVACTDRVVVLDARGDGHILGKLETGAGVDNIDYVEERRSLYAAAGKAQRLTVARVDDAGVPVPIAVADTARGTRVVVADAGGRAYVADSGGGRILVFPAAP